MWRAFLLACLVAACSGTGPSRDRWEVPELGEYSISLSGEYPSGGSWSRSFGVALERAERDSIRLVTIDGDLPAGIIRSANLIDWGDRDHWHTIFGVFNAPDVVLLWYPDLTCEGRLFVDFGASYAANVCSITKR